MHKPLVLVAALALSSITHAQIGGDGSDGAFVPDKDTTIDTTWKKGIFNFTKIVIPNGVTVTVKGPNPAFLYCTGVVIIDGTLNASANGQDPGPGGGKGGGPGVAGAGSGGGQVASGCSGGTYS
jgi:hypothetical protein